MGPTAIFDRPHANMHGRELVIEYLPTSWLERPLGDTSTNHFRQRRVCAAPMQLTEASRVGRDDAEAAVAFPSRDLRLHHCDEVEDHLPKLRYRTHANDKLDEPLSGLSQAHCWSMADVETIARVLAEMPTAGQFEIACAERFALRDYAKRQRGQHAIGNGTVR